VELPRDLPVACRAVVVLRDWRGLPPGLGRAPLNCPEPIPIGCWVASIIKPIWAGKVSIELIDEPVWVGPANVEEPVRDCDCKPGSMLL
jgi:hypothetical protein